ncbi:bifunctional 5,10-methylene-tetrahydrofolate dehydrogenase / 5,10-methylene-tetrahydrofolate cyclohydrolase [Lactobacillus delbrueckii]|uniref:bifunctional methylenetetrahydrofolate dehydrogenase/methenyltetrahydrofolate cyclohydrolase n=1 Tax=Lactobacillus delbrueckii TaxID=1584 RepID=UPI001E556934|nr:bifunctional methylenetetrahydrofolate dehydrogenase/methenyltetrahydrofolate cyclohydrolase [Lactobacillus delbrueckii]MCD9217840.1 bifunctional methylenetetrahydrofolate dehydrogenase/methenyltetrahydrofolate cyclohydrolase [Lactobacillus delbrueckii subsp. lactis]GHN20015.1 bifunctional 5,10-methylene-tetrahydrofolate dehydrogenase / 5,10-methylene-tetrahydrofolate cyclohydrolase [Lactobacillus delbrueckii]GHN21874.1 bifunctional 5,10-methylene-tetrahydrofolate dehydrogenase / 5,10-methyle
MGEILDGKKLARELGEKLGSEVACLKENGVSPKLCVINIGDDPASKVYVASKKRKAEKLGIKQVVYQLPADESEEDVLKLIDSLNADPEVSSLMVQLPVPPQINADRVIERIDPEKDVDCLTPANIGRLWQGKHFVEPATAAGIIAFLDHYQIDLTGKNAVIVGRSNIVGKPLAALMLERNASVSILHSRSRNLADLTKQADILVCAVGKAEMIKADMVKEGAVVIDVGINRVDGHLVGDVDFAPVKEKASWITPVPGGVGPLTVEFLMEEVIKLTRRQHGLD